MHHGPNINMLVSQGIPRDAVRTVDRTAGLGLAQETVPSFAASRRDEDLVALLLVPTSPSLGQHKRYWYNALRNAIDKGNPNVMQQLLEVGARLNRGNEGNLHGWQPLARAVELGHTDVVRALLDAGVSAADVDEEAVLIASLRDGHEDIAELLIKLHGIAIDVADEHGDTVLLCAAETA